MSAMNNVGVQVLAVLVALVPSDATTTVDWYKRSPDRVLKAEKVFRSYTHPTVSSCLSRCSSLTDCVSVSWNPQTFECRQSRNRIDHGPMMLVNTYIGHQWISYGKMLVRVWMVVGPGGRYTLRLDDARRECSLQGGRLATGEELLEARAAGLSLCSQGWMDDGRTGFVLQAPSVCFPQFSTGIIYTDRELADGWCIDNL